MTPETIWRYTPRDIMSQYGTYLCNYNGTNSRTFAVFVANIMNWSLEDQERIYNNISTHSIFAMMYAADKKLTDHPLADRDWSSIIDTRNNRAGGFDMTDCLCYAYVGHFRDGVHNIVDMIWTEFGDSINAEKLAGFFSCGAEQRCVDFESAIRMFSDVTSKAEAQGLIAMMDIGKNNPHFQNMLVSMREYRAFAPAVERMARYMTQE